LRIKINAMIFYVINQNKEEQSINLWIRNNNEMIFYFINQNKEEQSINLWIRNNNEMIFYFVKGRLIICSIKK